MRHGTVIGVVLAASSLIFAGNGAAQGSAQSMPSQMPDGQQQTATPAAPGQRGMGGDMMRGGMIGPDMMQMMGPMVRARVATERGGGAGGPLQMVQRLLKALDDTRVRMALGLTDQQADSLRKIIVDTETFTIKTGADAAVDAIDLREMLRADKPDKAAVMAKGDEISKDTSQLIDRYLDAALAAKAILTPQQQKMIRAYMERGATAMPAPPGRP